MNGEEGRRPEQEEKGNGGGEGDEEEKEGQLKSVGGEIGGQGEGGKRTDNSVKSKGNGVSAADRGGGAGAGQRAQRAGADREVGAGVHGGVGAGERAEGGVSDRSVVPPGEGQAWQTGTRERPGPTQPRDTSQTKTQTETRSWKVEGKKLTRRFHSARSDATYSARGIHENTWVAKIPLLLLCCMGLMGQLACVGAGPVPVSLHVERRGRTLQGQDFRLVCVVSPPLAAHTSPDFSWYRNGTLLQNQTGQVLRFSPLFKRDEGNYQCGLKIGDMERDQRSGPYSLPVYVLENIFLAPEVEVEEGQTVILNCSVHSDPTAFLTWRLGDKTLYSVRSNSDSLVLHNASQYHRQVVECEAYNNGLVLGFLDAYSIIRRKGTYEIVDTPYLGQKGVPVLHRPFGMECLVMELPNRGVNFHLTYTWYKDHKVIEGQSDMILDFPSLRMEDSGVYTCSARNGKPRTTSLESNSLEVRVFFSPVIHIEPRTSENVITQAAGATLNLTCKVTQAFPAVDHDGYRWSYLPSPGGQPRPLEGRESTLTLGPLTREDSGQYICQAWNHVDFNGLLPPGNASVTLDVMYQGNISLTSDLEVNEGDHVTLTCLVDCNPAARLSWLVEGQEVRHVTANVDHLVVERAACGDTKIYTCRASNPRLPGLERNDSTHVTVNCTSNRQGRMPDVDNFVVHGSQATVKGQSLRLRCLSSEAPGLDAGQTYVWVKDGRTLEHEDSEELTISSVTEKDLGVYQCGRKLAHSFMLSKSFELDVLHEAEEQTPGSLQIGLAIAVVLAVTAAVAVAITVVLCKRKKKRESLQENATERNGTAESKSLVPQPPPPDSRQEQHDSVLVPPTQDSGEVKLVFEETGL